MNFGDDSENTKGPSESAEDLLGILSKDIATSSYHHLKYVLRFAGTYQIKESEN